MPIVLKSGILKLLEPSGPVQACNEIALPFFTNIKSRINISRKVCRLFLCVFWYLERWILDKTNVCIFREEELNGRGKWYMIIKIGCGTMGEPVYTVGMEGANLSVGKKEVKQEVR
jgi:hypothetical protein